MSTRATGFTLIELLMAIAVLSIVLALALPGLTSARGAAESAAARAALQESIWSGMRVAQMEQQHVVICSSQNGTRCSGSTQWERGWIAFIDRNGDREPDPGVRLLDRHEGFDNALRISSTGGRSRITMQPFGGAAAGSNVTFTLCDARGPLHASTAVLANTGRLRVDKPPAGTIVHCP